MRRILLLFIAILVASGCTKSINQNAVIDHSEAGDLALSQGKLPQAKEMYSRALSDIRLVKMGPQAESQLHLKLARTLGKMCLLNDARSHFIQGITLNQNLYGDESPLMFPFYLEFGQFSYDVGAHKEAIIYLGAALDIGGISLRESAPVTYYEILRDYGDALIQTGDIKKAKEIDIELSRRPQLLEANRKQFHYSKKCLGDRYSNH